MPPFFVVGFFLTPAFDCAEETDLGGTPGTKEPAPSSTTTTTEVEASSRLSTEGDDARVDVSDMSDGQEAFTDSGIASEVVDASEDVSEQSEVTDAIARPEISTLLSATEPEVLRVMAR